MGDIVIADQGGGTTVDYWEVWHSNISPSVSVPFGGPCPRERGRAGTSTYEYDGSTAGAGNDGRFIIDLAYPFQQAGNITSWLIHSLTTGEQQMGQAPAWGQCWFLVMRIIAGTYTIMGAAPMTRNHPGAGVWEHTISPAIAVAKGDLCGVFLRKDSIGGGSAQVVIGKDIIANARVSEGLLHKLACVFINTDPVTGLKYPKYTDTMGVINNYTQASERIGIQARGDLGTQYQVKSTYFGGWYNGSSRSSFTANSTFQVDTGVTTAVATALTNLSDDSDLSGDVTIAAASTGTIYFRVATVGNLQPIEKVKIGFSSGVGSWGKQIITLQYSQDIVTADPPVGGGNLAGFQAVTGWNTFAVIPPDAENLSSGAPLQAGTSQYMNLARKVRFIRAVCVNTDTATNSHLTTLQIYGFSSQVDALGKFMSLNPGIRDRMYIDNPAATMRITTAISAGVTCDVIASGATVEEIGACPAGMTIYLRQSGGQHWPYVVDGINTGTRTITVHPVGGVTGTKIAEAYAVNDFVDPPLSFYEIRAFTAYGSEIGRSSKLGTHGNFRERVICNTSAIHTG
jgi:hypothetical protein